MDNQLGNLVQPLNTANEVMSSTGFSQGDIVNQQGAQGMIYLYHQGLYQMAILILIDILSDIIETFSDTVISKGHITKKQIERLLPSMHKN